jgi:hypothetical protein
MHLRGEHIVLVMWNVSSHEEIGFEVAGGRLGWSWQKQHIKENEEVQEKLPMMTQ